MARSIKANFGEPYFGDPLNHVSGITSNSASINSAAGGQYNIEVATKSDIDKHTIRIDQLAYNHDDMRNKILDYEMRIISLEAAMDNLKFLLKKFNVVPLG